jgi:uncharacterized protein (TIGR02186 family)
MSTIARPRALLALLALGLLLLAAKAARANELVADLSRHLIAITAAFVGSDVVLFGTTDGTGEVVALLEGPRYRQTVRKKSRVAGIWVNREQVVFDDVPAYYAIAASAPLERIADEDVRARLELGLEHLRVRPEDGPPTSAAEREAFRAALIRNKQQEGLYSDAVAEIDFLGERLFRTTFLFPANVPPGLYRVQVFQLKDGEVVGAQRSTLTVSKIGFEADLYDFAHARPMSYGLIAVLVAVMMGWLAGVIFRRA